MSTPRAFAVAGYLPWSGNPAGRGAVVVAGGQAGHAGRERLRTAELLPLELELEYRTSGTPAGRERVLDELATTATGCWLHIPSMNIDRAQTSSALMLL
jgi:hypothetical protein